MAMTNQQNENRQLQAIDHTAPAIGQVDLFNDARVKLIHETVAKGAPADVFNAMIDIARTRNLDPMAKQIGVAQFDKNSGWSIYMPIDGYRAVAGDSPVFAGKDKPEYGPVIGKTPLGKSIPEWCSVTVYRIVQGQRMPFTAEVWWEEFYGGERNRSWNKMPRVMLAKVAEAHALRMAFTRSLSGTYTPEEMDQASVEVQGRVVTQSTGEIQEPRQTREDRPHAGYGVESFHVAEEIVEENRGRTQGAQTRQVRSTATVVAEPAPDIADRQVPLYSESDEWQHASRKLHAIANNVIGSEQAHAALHIMAELKGVSSLKELPAPALHKMAEFLDGEPEKVDDYWKKWIAPRLEQSGEDGDA